MCSAESLGSTSLGVQIDAPMSAGYRGGMTWLEHAEHLDLRPLRAVEPHRLASQAAESAIELIRCLRDLLPCASESLAGLCESRASGTATYLAGRPPGHSDGRGRNPHLLTGPRLGHHDAREVTGRGFAVHAFELGGVAWPGTAARAKSRSPLIAGILACLPWITRPWDSRQRPQDHGSGIWRWRRHGIRREAGPRS
jgi:hypothetical protein